MRSPTHSFSSKPGKARPMARPVMGRLASAVGLGLVVAAAGLSGCVTPPFESPPQDTARTRTLYIPQNVRDKVDILFMVDNSASMDAMQAELRQRFPDFFKPFEDLAANGTYADLNIGVVTSDFGAGRSGAPGCTPSGPLGGGDQGKLQGVGKAADSSCIKPQNSNFIHYKFGPEGPAESNLPAGQNLNQTFTCMASVGAKGCGFEMSLESVYAALHNGLPENQGFLREDALLVVVFLTNEDDASAPPDTDVFDKTLVQQYGNESSYPRQTRFAVVCGNPPQFPPYGDSGGPLQGCKAAPNPSGSGPGKQYDISRYINYFTAPQAQGGVKVNPLDVVLLGIDATDSQFEVILSNPGTPAGQSYVQCPQLNETGNPVCVPVLQHSCINPQQPEFFGDPAVRLNAVIRSAHFNSIASICGSDDDYQKALKAAADLVVTTLAGGCIPDPLPRDPMTGELKTDCVVEDQTILADGSTSSTELPQCDASHSTVPCWTIEAKDDCTGHSPDGVGLVVDRGSTNGTFNQAPPHTTAQLSCATQSS